jgi:hypothetical protein
MRSEEAPTLVQEEVGPVLPNTLANVEKGRKEFADDAGG